MNIWIFGDSFAHDYNIDYQWVNQIKKLDCTIHNLALEGSSLDHAYFQFNSVRSQILHNDCVVFVATDIDRQWFVKEQPGHALMYIHRKDNIGKAVKQYWKYLNNDTVSEQKFLNFAYNLQDITKTLDLRTIILNVNPETYEVLKRDTWKNFHIGERCLHNIQRAEYATGICDYWRTLYKIDTKPNHLLKFNHMMLAERICDCIKNNNTLELDKVNFLEMAITKQLVDSDDDHWILM